MAVLIDATLIRGVLLPATMKLLGDWNWYLPRWLEWLPHVGPVGGPALPRRPIPPRSPPPRRLPSARTASQAWSVLPSPLLGQDLAVEDDLHRVSRPPGKR